MFQNKKRVPPHPTPAQIIRGKRSEPLSSRKLLLNLNKSPSNLKKMEGTSLLAREEASKTKSPRPHPRQEETENFLQVNDKEESSISNTRTDKPLQIVEQEDSSVYPSVLPW